jgi:outer membrane protein assembly factor BamB
VAADGKGELRTGLYGDIGAAKDDGSQAWKVYCLDKKTGRVRWEKTAHEGSPKVHRHTKATHANSTVAMDAERVVAILGSEGLFAFDHAGRLLWSKDLGVLDAGFFRVPEAQWGYAASPVLHEGRVIVQADLQKGSFLAAFDAATGRELWRTPRTDAPTWSTPTVHTLAGPPQIVVNGWRHAGGYDFATGAEIWKLHGRGDIPVPTPVIGDGLVYLTSAHGAASTFAVRPTAKGDVTPADGASSNEHVAWSSTKDSAYMQTPLLYGGHLYVCRDNGVLTVFDATTGAVAYQQRLGEGKTGFTASPVASGGRLFFTSEDGDVYVLKAGPAYELVATNALGEPSLATPAVSEGRIYFRTRDHLVAVGEAKK